MFAAQVLPVFIILFGPCVGSFIGVCADRYPRGQSVVAPRSICLNCGKRLSGFELIPILSFALQRGTCRTCGTAIDPRLFYLEIIAAGLGVLAVLAGGDPGHMALTALFLWLLLALATIDLVAFRLPDPFTIALGIVAIWRAPDLGQALLGAAIGAMAFALLRVTYRAVRKREGLGLGDVKLMVGLGAAAGPFGLSLLVLIAALIALAVAVVVHGPSGKLAADRPLPFGAALCASAMILWGLGVL